jgi:lysophospholipase L1-like esterase
MPALPRSDTNIMSKKLKTLLLGIFIALLAVSAGLNVFLYQKWRSFYMQLNGVRLDPLGLSIYSGHKMPPSNERPTIVFLGDSRAEGWKAPAGLPGTIINRGAGNQTSIQVLGRFAEDVLPLKPDVIVLQVGVNDLKTIPLFPENKARIIADLEANVQRIIDLSVQNGARVMLTTMFPVGRVPLERRLFSLERRLFWSDDVALAVKEINQHWASLASDKVTVFDTTPILADQEGLVNEAYSKDLLHLNANGYEALNPELIRLINR